MGEQYTIEDFLDGKIYVLCVNDEERQKLRDLSGWGGIGDALYTALPPVLYRHERYDRGGYGYTFFSKVGRPYYKHLPIVAFEKLGEATPDDVQFDSGMFLAMLGCGGERR